MNNTLRTIARNTLLMFTVGLLLAVASPAIAGFIGEETLGQAVFESAKATSVLWTGAFFGAFGAIQATIAPLFNHVFADATGKEAPAPQMEKSQSKELANAPAPAPDVALFTHRDALAAKRDAACQCPAHTR